MAKKMYRFCNQYKMCGHGIGFFTAHLCHLIILIGFLISIEKTIEAETNDLYSDKDSIVRLNSSTFIPVVYHSKRNVVSMVQFYNTYCGHCQMFAPIYKELAQRVQNWSTVLRVAGVDCSKDENIATCTDNNISGYPTILLFPPKPKVGANQESGKDNKGGELEATNFREIRTSRWDLDELEEGLIDYMMRLIGRRHVPSVIYRLRPLTTQTMSEFFQQRRDKSVDEENRNDIMIIMENENSYVGRKLILEFSQISYKLELHVVFSNNTQLITSILSSLDSREKLSNNRIQPDEMPVLLRCVRLEDGSDKIMTQILLKAGEDTSQLRTDSNSEDHADFSFNKLKRFINKYYTYEIEEARKQSVNNENELDSFKENSNSDENGEIKNTNSYLENGVWPVNFKKEKIYSTDLIKSIRYIIHHEILAKGDLRPNHYLIVKSLLDILLRFLPLQQWNRTTDDYLRTLKQQLDVDRQHYETNGLTRDKFNDILQTLDASSTGPLPDVRMWLYCHDSQIQNKGYPCSLWTLFHVLTVGEFMKASPSWGNLHAVLYTMRDYIINFFGCTDCAQNFHNESDQLESHLKHRNASILWLWQTHNRVRRRLYFEKSPAGRGQRDLVIFPSAKQCPLCYATGRIDASGAFDLESFDVNDESNWNMEEVFKFLLTRYRPDHVIVPEFRHSEHSQILAEIPESSEDHARKFAFEGDNGLENSSDWRSSFLSPGDMGIVFILYLLCVIIIVTVCIALNPRFRTNYRKLSKSMLAYNV